jgi:hypothetical protein
MVDYRADEPRERVVYTDDTRDRTVVKRRSGGTVLFLVLVVAALIVALLFATGFWSADVTKEGALPSVSVNGGALPKVDLQSKEVVVGTTPTNIEVPKVETKTETVNVPTIGVKDDKK